MRRLILLAIACSAATFPPTAHAITKSTASARATDLLTAKHAASEARKRLELPGSRGAGWVSGGDGFGHRRAETAPTEREPEVHIHLGTARAKKRKPAER